CRYECHGSGTFAADLLQHGEIVSGADSEIFCDNLPFTFIRQDTGKKSPALVAVKTAFSERQRMGQRNRAGMVQPALGIMICHLTILILNELAHQMPPQI